MFDPSNVFLRLARKFGPESFVAKFLSSIGVLASSSMYTQKALATQIRSVIGPDGDGEATLGTDKLRTLLLVVTRNASTDSPWPISNNPYAMYNNPKLPDCNLKIPLWQLVRASTAAPIFFPPEVIDIGDQPMNFVDGGVTVYQNPAFVLFLMATLPSYKLNWQAGEDDLLLVSIGTGLSKDSNLGLQPHQMNVMYNLEKLPTALIVAATVEQDKLCRIFGHTRTGGEIDSEIGDLADNRSPLSEKLFTYLRYDVRLSRKGLDELGLNDIDVGLLGPFDIEHLDQLQAVGKAAANKFISDDAFQGFV